MRYAEVAVDAPIGVDRTLTYSVPASAQCVPGQLVWVPLGRRPVQGIVFKITDEPQVEQTRLVDAVIEPAKLVFDISLSLARWISRYYLCSLFDAVSLFLPPGFKRKVTATLRSLKVYDPELDLSRTDALIWRRIVESGHISERTLVKSLGKGASRSIARLVRRGCLTRSWILPVDRPSPKYRTKIQLQLPECDSQLTILADKKTPRQTELFNELIGLPSGMPLPEVNKRFGATVVNGLASKGLLSFESVREDSGNRNSCYQPGERLIELTPHQSEAVRYVEQALDDRQPGPKSLLLHGVTGSGKTEVYLQALERCIARGRRAILLVPEISLTPQMVQQVNKRFPGRVVMTHGTLSPRARFDAWWRMWEGTYDVVVGPRSALFSPIENLGLIVVDEEHEWTYKSAEVAPYYHARDVALKLGNQLKIPVLMGSATPDVVTYFRARQGGHRLFRLPKRIKPTTSDQKTTSSAIADLDNTDGLAQIKIVDMRDELKKGNRSPISDELWNSLEGCVKRGEQAILFLNRRGAATLVQCRDCGHVVKCKRCSMTLTFHRSGDLVCHLCNRRGPVPSDCSECSSTRIRYLGLGTQKVIEDVKYRLPSVSTIRWDSDTTAAVGGHRELMDSFSSGMAQVVVGTQMVAKGLHVPNVSLVGVVLADVGLHLPDFRAGERAFQLLCQVAGRAGRGSIPGQVIIQTYDPDNYAIEAASRQDYLSLYNKEMTFRREHGTPPINRLAKLTFLHTNDEACRTEATKLATVLKETIFARGLAYLDVIGPAPGHPLRIRGRYRWNILLRGRELHVLLSEVSLSRGWSIDIDPVSVL
ncbi:primosomal protein N' [SAR202 cluster bacterium AD-804-J14_MRT_500m]|nr:primosomal protein N' [SAR202 cluster bacterium AD-804-J14_MRT_500m]